MKNDGEILLVYNDKYPNMTLCKSQNMSLTIVDKKTILDIASCSDKLSELNTDRIVEVLPNKRECKNEK